MAVGVAVGKAKDFGKRCGDFLSINPPTKIDCLGDDDADGREGKERSLVSFVFHNLCFGRERCTVLALHQVSKSSKRASSQNAGQSLLGCRGAKTIEHFDYARTHPRDCKLAARKIVANKMGKLVGECETHQSRIVLIEEDHAAAAMRNEATAQRPLAYWPTGFSGGACQRLGDVGCRQVRNHHDGNRQGQRRDVGKFARKTGTDEVGSGSNPCCCGGSVERH